jgi:hypothetical protein
MTVFCKVFLKFLQFFEILAGRRRFLSTELELIAVNAAKIDGHARGKGKNASFERTSHFEFAAFGSTLKFVDRRLYIIA